MSVSKWRFFAIMAKMLERPTTELYFIRHAETVMNVSPHLVGGRSNETPLTEKGIEQARRLGRVLLKKEMLPSKVFVSPALRTIDTARYSLQEMGLDLRPSIHPEIQELSQGVWEGRLRSEAYTEDVIADIHRLGKHFKLEGGESMNDVGHRMHNWVNEIFGELPDVGQRHFIYTHGGAIKYLLSRLLDWDHLQTYNTPIDNASLSLLKKSPKGLEVVFWNRDAEEI